jgi:DNA-binding transcriptional MerR regulator
MKFSKLIGKAEKLVDKQEQGEPIEADKLTRLQSLLTEKLERYEAKLEETLEPHKRQKLQARLRVVKAQLQKSIDLTKPN